MQVEAVAFEYFVRLHMHGDIQIARRRAVAAGFALAAQTDALAVVDTGRNIHFHRFAGLHPALAAAFQARVFDFLARAVAGGTGLLHLENRLADVYRTRTPAGGTGGGGGTGLGAAAVAHVAFFVSRDGQAFLHTLGGFLKADFHRILQIGTLVILLPRTAPAAEHLAENIAEIETLRAAETAETARARTCALFERGMAVLVVHRPFLFVGQGVVGFLNFFKFFFGLLVALIAVGMVFHGQLAVGFFDFVLTRSSGYAQCGVKILIAHGSVLV